MVQETADRYIEAGQVSSIEELMESAIASQGIADYEYQTLNPLTDYCVWACGVDLQARSRPTSRSSRSSRHSTWSTRA